MKTMTIRGTMALVAALGGLFAAIAYQVRAHRMIPEAARRTQCINNLKQIGIAIDLYCRRVAPPAGLGHGAYPSGTIPNAALPLEERTGWGILTYAIADEGCSGCHQLDPDRAWDDPRQGGAGGDGEEMYCPSAARATVPIAKVPAAYIGIAGLGVDAPSLPLGDRRAGIFGDDRVVGPVDATDGLSRTMMVVESSIKRGPWFAGARNTVRGLDPTRAPYLGRGRQFGGNHGEGAMALMADGSVRYLAESVDPRVFEALSTIHGGEKVTVPREK